MSISKLGGTSSDNWELISSVTPTAASAAVNFTGLSPYKKLFVRWNGIVLNAMDGVYLRINNDSGSKYNYQTGAGAYPLTTDSFKFFNSIDTSHRAYAILNNCDTASIKQLLEGAGGNSVLYQVQGYYMASAVVTQINVITGSTFTAVGTVELYGVK